MQFKSAAHLLAWAFETSERPILRSARCYDAGTAEVRGGGSVGMSAHDKHAQAAVVMAFLSSLPVGQKCVVFGLFNPTMRENMSIAAADSVPGKYGFQAARYAARMWMTPVSQKGASAGSEVELAAMAGCSAATAHRYKHAVWTELDTRVYRPRNPWTNADSVHWAAAAPHAGGLAAYADGVAAETARLPGKPVRRACG